MGIRDKLFGKSKSTSNKNTENSDNTDKKEFSEMDHDVYICYSTHDIKIANKVCYVLEQNDLKCWIAPRNISGRSYTDEIANAIKSAKVVVLIFSENSQASKFVINEVEMAFSNNMNIIPFFIDDYYPHGEMDFFLMSYNWLHAYPNPEESYETLVNEVNNLCNYHPLSKSYPLPPYDGEDNYIFVSYDYDDKNEVFADIRKFQNLGYNVWYDDGKTANEDKRKKNRVGHLRSCNLCIVFVTNASMASSQIQKEIKYAVKHNKNMIPIYLEDFDSIEMEDEIDFELSVIQGITKTTLDEEEYVFKFTEAFEKFGFKFSKK